MRVIKWNINFEKRRFLPLYRFWKWFVICLDVKNSSLKVAIQMSREFKLSFRIGVSK